MARLIAALVILGALVVAVKVAIIVLIFAGLIFRTKETLGILLLLGLGALVTHNPILAGIPVAILLIIGAYKALSEPG